MFQVLFYLALSKAIKGHIAIISHFREYLKYINNVKSAGIGRLGDENIEKESPNPLIPAPISRLLVKCDIAKVLKCSLYLNVPTV